ncbi:hypothetical protein [Streptomyces sp. NPDC093260]|uniref:hypothetical protein n=1 Tax=Streptomyces sp. NPDC093260 TaxID=3155073 RepID=UPI0034214193
MFLEALDLAAQGRLRHVQVGGGPAEVLVRRHHGEVTHQPQFQVLSEIIHRSSLRVMPFGMTRFPNGSRGTLPSWGLTEGARFP